MGDWLSRRKIIKKYDLAEETFDLLLDLDVFIPHESKVVRGSRHYNITEEEDEVFKMAKLHYASVASKKLFLLPCHRAFIFFLLTQGPGGAFDTLSHRGYVGTKRITLAYCTSWLTTLIRLAPPALKVWLNGEEPEPTEKNQILVDSFLALMGIDHLFENPDLADVAIIYTNDRVRQEVDGMLLTTSTYDDIVSLVDTVHEIELDKDDLGYYHSLYFDPDLCGAEGVSKYVESFGNKSKYLSHLAKSMAVTTFSEYIKAHQVPYRVKSKIMLSEMLMYEQQHYLQVAHPRYSRPSECKRRALAVNNTLSIIDARKALEGDDTVTDHDRLMLEFADSPDLKVLERKDINPSSIDSLEVINSAGMYTSAEELEDAISQRQEES